MRIKIENLKYICIYMYISTLNEEKQTEKTKQELCIEKLSLSERFLNAPLGAAAAATHPILTFSYNSKNKPMIPPRL